MNIINVGSSSAFSTLLRSSELVFVDFWATWCGPCRMQAPVLEELAKSVDTGLIAKVDVDDQREIAEAYGIENIPTLILFKNGKEAKRFVGVQELATLLACFNK